MEDNFNQLIDTTVQDLIDVYDDTIYTNNNNEITAVNVNACFSETATQFAELFKKLINLNCKITAYRNLNIYEDEGEEDKSYITASNEQGWLIRVDIPRLIFRLYYSSTGAFTMLHSILVRSESLDNWNVELSYEGNGFPIYGATYDNRNWSQGDLWTTERELTMYWPSAEYTLMFFVKEEYNMAIVPDLYLNSQTEAYWTDGPTSISTMQPYEYNRQTQSGGEIVPLEFRIKDLLSYLVE